MQHYARLHILTQARFTAVEAGKNSPQMTDSFYRSMTRHDDRLYNRQPDTELAAMFDGDLLDEFGGIAPQDVQQAREQGRHAKGQLIAAHLQGKNVKRWRRDIEHVDSGLADIILTDLGPRERILTESAGVGGHEDSLRN